MKKLGSAQQEDLLSFLDVPKEKQNAQRTPFRITPELKKVLTLELINSGYGIKGKSRWVTEAIQAMLDDPRYTTRKIYHAQILEYVHTHNEKSADSVNLPYPVWVQAWHAMLDTMRYGASLTPPEYAEVTISSVLHIAILNRLSACTVHE